MDSTYRVDLGRILDDLGESIHITDDITLGTLMLGAEQFQPTAPARLDMTLTNTGAGVVGHGSISALFDAICARCLKGFVLPVTGEIDSFYVMPDQTGELPEEQDYELIQERAVDIMPALLAALTVELPFAPLHDPDCKGICAVCGTNLNEQTCECVEEAATSPFSALRGMFDEEEGD